MAQITGNKPGKAYHKIVNAHIYEDQLELMRDVQLKREPFPSPQLEINPDIKTLEDLETWVTMDDFKVVGYQSTNPSNILSLFWAFNVRSDLDEKFMQHALMLADRAEALGEIPVGAVLVDDEGNILGEGWNLSIIGNDPTAHAEIVALRNAAQNIQNYRLLNTTLYVTP